VGCPPSVSAVLAGCRAVVRLVSSENLTSVNSHNNQSLETDHIRVVGYVRVSTLQQADEGVSLDAQRPKLRAYVSALDLDLCDITSDEGASAGIIVRFREVLPGTS
jgi:hypothetical protein